MQKESETSFMGPALFIGLTLYMLITGKPVEREINPRRAMELLAAQTEQIAPKAPAPAEARRTPLGNVPERTKAAPVATPRGETPLIVPAALPIIRHALLDATLAPPASRSHPPARRIALAGAARPSARWLALPQVAARLPETARPEQGAPAIAASHAASRRAERPAAPEGQPADTPPAGPHLARITVIGDAVHLRARPSARSGILSKLSEGQQARLLGRSGNWARIYLPEAAPPLTGWIYRTYIDVAQNSES